MDAVAQQDSLGHVGQGRCSDAPSPMVDGMKTILDRLAETSPIPVLARACLENVLSADAVNEIFRKTAVWQFQRSILFSDIVDLMCLVVCRVAPSVHAGYRLLQNIFSVSPKSVYNKLNKLEPEVIRNLVRHTAQRMCDVVDEFKVENASPIPGYEVRILDGNHHPASERRLKVLRNVAAGPLPGLTLVVYDPRRGLVVDCIPCEDGHAQERSVVTELLENIEPGVVWIADRNFCTSTMLLELSLHKAFFVIRRHAGLPLRVTGPVTDVGPIETGHVTEQAGEVLGEYGEAVKCRIITIALNTPTRDGDMQLQIITNLPLKVDALTISRSYRDRWKIEVVNAELEKHFASEQTTLGYPPATLFAFGVSLVAFNVVRIVHASLEAAHGSEQTKGKISNYYLAHALQRAWESTKLIKDEEWETRFSKLTPRELAAELRCIAKHVDLRQYLKAPKRGPKKPPPERTKYKGKTHVSTQRLLGRSNRK